MTIQLNSQFTQILVNFTNEQQKDVSNHPRTQQDNNEFIVSHIIDNSTKLTIFRDSLEFHERTTERLKQSPKNTTTQQDNNEFIVYRIIDNSTKLTILTDSCKFHQRTTERRKQSRNNTTTQQRV